MYGPHPSHKTRISFDASTYDEICVYCGATDEVLGGWGDLVYPCPNAPTGAPVPSDPLDIPTTHLEALRLACHLEDDPH